MARDALGRRVPAGSAHAVSEISDVALPAPAALAFARELLGKGRAFAAHEVFEAVWKACPAGERDLWQGLAQVCVGLTHLQRGNAVGAVTLLRRGAGHLRADAGLAGAGAGSALAGSALAGSALAGSALDVGGVADRAEALAEQVAAGGGFHLAALSII